MIGADLEIKFWLYAFVYVLESHNAVPGKGQDKAPIHLATGEKDNPKFLKTFGCRVYLQPPGIQVQCFKDKAQKGIFLGYVLSTSQNIYGIK